MVLSSTPVYMSIYAGAPPHPTATLHIYSLITHPLFYCNSLLFWLFNIYSSSFSSLHAVRFIWSPTPPHLTTSTAGCLSTR